MKARVYVFYKDSVFDPQGNTLAQSLRHNGFAKVTDVRVGKVIDVTMEGVAADEARGQVQKMCEKLLSNPVIESFKYELREDKK
ncbi:MAG: phosphoribosylformylglycinamidine synthase subunit PurS [Deltaproteobacteria bacterium]|nr:phosphoribosylformylglycinamidine synthase subunit PurS [Deltaproteobacteria bacterium]